MYDVQIRGEHVGTIERWDELSFTPVELQCGDYVDLYFADKPADKPFRSNVCYIGLNAHGEQVFVCPSKNGQFGRFDFLANVPAFNGKGYTYRVENIRRRYDIPWSKWEVVSQ